MKDDARPRSGRSVRAGNSSGTVARDESPKQVSARADRVVARIRLVHADVLALSSGHFIRVLAARWISAEPTIHAASFLLIPPV